jgi:uncharacterized NAD(P)/FAD-binding protein YdhS
VSDRILIVGGGFSGAMLAARLAEAGTAVSLINRDDRFGLGVAYGAAEPWHLLNVRSARMSAVADRPDDFVRWLEAHAPGHADPEGFAPRAVYGRYVQDRLAAARAAAADRLETLTGEVVGLDPAGAVTLADGRRLSGRAVVLATGNPPPRTAAPGDTGSAAGVIPDAWAPGALDGIRPQDDILLVGTGLTMVDVLMTLERRGWIGRAVAVSRRGLRPRAHGPRPDPKLDAPLPDHPRLSQRLAAARAAAGDGGWRSLMELYRPVTADLWATLDPEGQRRLLRHLRPWWDVHRHRLAPEVAARIDALVAADRLQILAGRIGRPRPAAGRLELSWRPRGQTGEGRLVGDRLIDCSGPGHAPQDDPLTGPLLAAGAARLHPNGLGLDLAPDGRILAADGRPQPGLFVLGPPARAAFWETIAVPDIRDRIAALAGTLAPH